MKRIIFGEDKNIISKNMRALRNERKLTQKDLAAKLQTYNINIDQQMISKIENNTRIVTDYELVYICIALQVDVNEMLQNYYDSLKKQ